MIANRTRDLGMIALFIVVCAAVLFWRLDSTVLWRDETTTANWARTMVEQGSLIPKVFDGKTLSAQGFDAHDFNSSLTPGMQGWLQFYVTALSFKLFGVSTFTARLPLALLGIVAAGVMWAIGRRLYGNNLYALVFPTIALFSIWFLNIYRQSRYYGLVFLFSALIFYEFVRYLQDRELATKLSWYLRVSLWSAGVYCSHYLGFAGLYASLCLFVLLAGDRTLLRRWIAMTSILVVIFGAEFFAFHFDFASNWSSATQPWEAAPPSLMERIEAARRMHDEEMMRMLPLLFLVPGLFFAVGRKEGPLSGYLPLAPVALCVACGLITVFTRGFEYYPLVVAGMILVVAVAGYAYLRLRVKPVEEQEKARIQWYLPVLMGGALVMGLAVSHVPENQLLYLFSEVLAVGLLIYAILRFRAKGNQLIPTEHGVVLLAILVLVVSIIVVVGIGLEKAYARYYYQVLMASNVLAAFVCVELLKRRKEVGAIFLGGCLLWPNIAFNIGANAMVVERQLTASQEVDVPAVEFLRANAQPGDRFVVYRNVQGMMLHFYLPELHWVGQLDSRHPDATRYRNRLPDTAYDDVQDVHWYIVWDNRNITPKGLDDRYELVYEREYEYPMSWWEKTRGVRDVRKWSFYKRKDLTRGPYPATAPPSKLAAASAH